MLVPVFQPGSSGWVLSRALQLPPKRLRGFAEIAGELEA